MEEPSKGPLVPDRDENELEDRFSLFSPLTPKDIYGPSYDSAHQQQPYFTHHWEPIPSAAGRGCYLPVAACRKWLIAAK